MASSSSSAATSNRRPSALDLFKVRAAAPVAAPSAVPTSRNNDSSGARSLLRDDAPPLVLPKPPPRNPVGAAFTGGYGRDAGLSRVRPSPPSIVYFSPPTHTHAHPIPPYPQPKVNPDRISQLAKPKYKPSAPSSSTAQKSSGSKYR